MDLVGPISPQTSKGNRYMLTVIDMLTGYTIAVAIPDKRAETVCKAYRDHVLRFLIVQFWQNDLGCPHVNLLVEPVVI